MAYHREKHAQELAKETKRIIAEKDQEISDIIFDFETKLTAVKLDLSETERTLTNLVVHLSIAS